MRAKLQVLLFVDNQDSFTFNLVQAFRVLGTEVRVRSSEELTTERVRALERHPPSALCLGPGPGRPEAASANAALLASFAERIPILGICLGHQSIAHGFGARIERSSELTHGRTSSIHHGGQGLFAGLPSPLTMTRYNSLTVRAASLPPELEPCARDDRGEVMALRHRTLPIHGLQFHPEALRSVGGAALLMKFLQGPGAAQVGHGTATLEQPAPEAAH